MLRSMTKKTIKLEMKSLGDLPEVAEQIIESAKGKEIVAFYGAMGAGKTTLIREIAEQLGVVDNVTSPTFSLVNQYMTNDGEQIFHFDFYRIEKIEEAYDFGYEEYFFSGNLCLVEWPEKIEELLPEDTLIVKIELDSTHHHELRIVTIE